MNISHPHRERDAFIADAFLDTEVRKETNPLQSVSFWTSH